MTLLRIHRQLEGAQKRAEKAVEIADAGRRAIEDAIEGLNSQLDALRSGCVDVELGDALVRTEVRVMRLIAELERFERDVTQPAEELHRMAVARIAAFEAKLAKNRAPAPRRQSISRARRTFTQDHA